MSQFSKEAIEHAISLWRTAERDALPVFFGLFDRLPSYLEDCRGISWRLVEYGSSGGRRVALPAGQECRGGGIANRIVEQGGLTLVMARGGALLGLDTAMRTEDPARRPQNTE